LERAGVEVVPCRARRGRVDLADVLDRLGRRAMSNVLVEGGGEVLSEYLGRGLADEAYVFVAPRLIGGRGTRVLFENSLAVGVEITSRGVGADRLYRVRFR